MSDRTADRRTLCLEFLAAGGGLTSTLYVDQGIPYHSQGALVIMFRRLEVEGLARRDGVVDHEFRWRST